jgi:hypothetical protein
MGYFTVSTEHRLIAEQLYKNNEERIKSDDHNRANIYHLLAISFLAVNLNCDLLFMKQIVSSYEHHFKLELVTDEGEEGGIDTLAERLLFEEKKEKGKSNTSLLDKINKLKIK